MLQTSNPWRNVPIIIITRKELWQQVDTNNGCIFYFLFSLNVYHQRLNYHPNQAMPNWIFTLIYNTYSVIFQFSLRDNSHFCLVHQSKIAATSLDHFLLVSHNNLAYLCLYLLSGIGIGWPLVSTTSTFLKYAAFLKPSLGKRPLPIFVEVALWELWIHYFSTPMSLLCRILHACEYRGWPITKIVSSSKFKPPILTHWMLHKNKRKNSN